MAQQWITRQKSGKGFRYLQKEKPVRDVDSLAYITSLKIPPAWRDVRIALNKRSKILATGVDQADQLQYIYNPAFRARQEAAKFERVLRFARALPHMRRIVDKDITRP